MTSSNQRGGIIRSNDNGTLERVDRTNTYIGSATLDNGRVITKRFRCTGFDEEEVAERWLAWQGRKGGSDEDEDYYEEEDMAANDKTPKCPFSGSDCTATCPVYSVNNRACSVMLGGVGLYNMAANIMKLKVDEELEMIVLALEDLKSKSEAGAPAEKPAERKDPHGIDAFFEGKTFLSFVNLHSKNIAGQYAKFCKANGYEPAKESEVLAEVVKRYPELKKVGLRGGSVFQAA